MRLAEAPSPAVAVVVPAFNAASTLDETLRSVRRQTFRNLEIVVVEDGSTDATAEIAARHAEADPRVRLLRQANAGVAAARNRGLADTTAALVAFVDADDLWVGDKIERQVAAMEAAGPQCGLVYGWSAWIDEASRIVARDHRPCVRGDAMRALCLGNFIGNASSALFRRGVLEAVGGFDETLRARGAQGCEDYAIFLRVAERRRFDVVEDFLTGYRQTAGAMSADLGRMRRSARLVAADAAARRPDLAGELRWGEASVAGDLLRRAFAARRFAPAARLVLEMLRDDPRLAARALRLVLSAPRLGPAGERFPIAET